MTLVDQLYLTVFALAGLVSGLLCSKVWGVPGFIVGFLVGVLGFYAAVRAAFSIAISYFEKRENAE